MCSRFYKAVYAGNFENIEKKSGKYGFIHSATIHEGDELFSVDLLLKNLEASNVLS